MIQPYSNATLSLWNRGLVQVEIRVPTSDRPIAYCDGTEQDEAELATIAEDEGTDLPVIHKRVLKTGRQIWTVGEAPVAEASDDRDVD